MVSKVLLSWVAENAVQLNLQATLLALARRAACGEDGVGKLCATFVF